MKILVLGVSGMIGSAIFKVLSATPSLDVWGSLRDSSSKNFFAPELQSNLITSSDCNDLGAIVSLLNETRPEVVINCIGLTKHKKDADDPLIALPINALMPHKLASACTLIRARLIHISTDCVFSGKKGNYVEEDLADAVDVYGKSKALGEVISSNAITLRTSTIGHELYTKYGLLEWFLSQKDKCSGYSKAIFSGLPSMFLAQVIRDFVIPSSNLSGLYHVAAGPIDKYKLLQLISKIYSKDIKIELDETLAIDRSLNCDKFKAATGYIPLSWPTLIEMMHKDKKVEHHV
jgi:dTDP-4-dehydrorhamnose reductase